MQAHRGGDQSAASDAPALLTGWPKDAPAAGGALNVQDPADLARIGHASRDSALGTSKECRSTDATPPMQAHAAWFRIPAPP